MPRVRPGTITATEIRAAMFGSPIAGLTVVRQAWRTTADDSDELALLYAYGSWWIARRLSDQLTVWAYAGDVEAEQGFELLLSAARGGDPEWTEATQALLAS